MTFKRRSPKTLTRSHALNMLTANRAHLKRLGVEKIALYGSVARDEATAESDVDVLVELADELLTLEGYMDLCFYLEELFGRHVDVSTCCSLPPYMRDRVLTEAVYLEMRENVATGSGSC